MNTTITSALEVRLASCSFFFLMIIVAGAVNAESLRLYPDRDATLIQHPHGELANGAGPSLFVGRTNQSSNSIRRALLHFAVAGALPSNAIIEDVSLTLHLASSNTTPSDIGIHRVLDDWGEGPSSSAGGSGATAQAGDVTWLHTFHNTAYWRRVGAHSVTSASATAEVEANDTYTWNSASRLVADVRHWLYAPRQNYGWLLIGDETTSQNVKRFNSRETPTDEFRPVLTIHYRLSGKP